MTVASPCTNVCRIEPRSKLCLGCRRTVDEITRWPLASDAERRAILADLPSRTLKDSRMIPKPKLLPW